MSENKIDIIVDAKGRLICEVRSLSKDNLARLQPFLDLYDRAVLRGDLWGAAAAEQEIVRILDEINGEV